MYDRSGSPVVDLVFPREDFLLLASVGAAARQLAWSAGGECLAVLPRAQAGVLLWSPGRSDLVMVDAAIRVSASTFQHLCT